MKLEYYYDKETFVKISLTKLEQIGNINPKFVYIDFSNNILNYIKHITPDSSTKDEIKSELNQLFCDEYDSIFIPAGRSLITILTSQLNYLFASMDDDQKRSIDYCTQKYIEYILKIKPLFSESLRGLAQNSIYKTNSNSPSIIEYISTEKNWKN